MKPPTTRSVKVNVLAGWLCHLSALLVSFLLMPYVLGVVGDASYGVWLLLGSLAGYSGLLYLGFGETIARYVSRHATRDDWDGLNETVSGIFAAYLVSSGLALLGAIGLAGLAPYVSNWSGHPLAEVQWAIIILGLNAALAICGSLNGGILHGIQRFDIEQGIQILGQLVRLVLVLTLLSHRQPLLTLSLIFTTITLVEQSLYYFAARRLLPTLKIQLRLMRWSAVKESYSFALFNGLGLIANKLIYETDVIVIGFCLGASHVVPYAIGLRLCDMIRAPIRSIGEVFLPRAGQLQEAARQKELQSLVARGMGLAVLLSGGFLIGAWFFGGLLISAWMPSPYPQSHLVFAMLVAAQVVALPVSILQMVLVGLGQVRVPSLLRLASAMANLLLSLVLVRDLGLPGVALGTLIPILLIDLCLLLPYGARHLDMPLPSLLKQVLGPQLLPLTALLAYSTAVSYWPLQADWPTLILITLGGGLILGAVWGSQWIITRRLATSTLTA